MTVVLNGKATDARGAKTIEELITSLDLSPQTILIEHNGLALRRREWHGRELKAGDRIELVRVVAGG